MYLFRKIFSVSFILLLVSIIISCTGDSTSGTEKKEDTGESINIDLDEIKQRGTLRAITVYSSTSYFIYRGKPMGYEFELLKRLADHLELDLEIIVAEDLDNLLKMLKQGKGDIISYGLTVTKQRKKQVAFTNYHTKTHQVLVQRKPKNWRSMKLHNIDKKLIRDPLELIGETVHIRANSPYYDRLMNLSDEIGGEIKVETVPGNTETEELIKMVAEGEILYTIADENIARINATYYSNLDVETAVSFNQRVAWAVRKNSTKLLSTVNGWISDMKQQTDYYVIYNKYFKNRKAYKRRARSEFFSRKGNRISEYDELIKNYSNTIGWDWRLLASLIYQESGWDAKTKSWAGAVGLMQVMPFHAEDCGATDLFVPEQNIMCGTHYLKFLKRQFNDIPDSTQRLKFILASYNVGQNHVKDARRLAEKYGKNPDIWTDNVDEFILKKSKPEYYNDDVVKYGYCRGTEPYNYVREILERFDHYQKFIEM